MKKLQTLKTKSGIECVLFPMQYMNITQGVNGQFSHKGDNALDLAGKDRGIDPFFMPVTAKIVWKDPKIGGVVYESLNKVLYADGTYDFIHFMTLHDNYIGDLGIGRIFPQGCETGDEGTAGYATGNHIHLVFGRGKYPGGYPMVKNSYGTWVLPKQVDPHNVMFIDGTTIKNDLGYKFKKYEGQDIVKDEPKSQLKYKVGTRVCTNTIWTQANGGSEHHGDWEGTITDIYENTLHPYLLDNGDIGFTNDDAIDSDPHIPGQSKTSYYPKYNGTSQRIDEVFKAIGAPYGSWSKRKPLAAKNGFVNYTGTETQNNHLIQLAKEGKLVK